MLCPYKQHRTNDNALHTYLFDGYTGIGPVRSILRKLYYSNKSHEIIVIIFVPKKYA